MKDLSFLFPYIRKYKAKFLGGLLFVTISNICSTYIPRLVGNMIDLIKTGQFSMASVEMLILYLLLLTIGSGLFMFLTRRTIIVSSRLIEYDIRRDFLESIERQDTAFFHKNPTGKLMAHASNDIGAARDFMGPALMYAANTITTFSFALYFMLKLNASITIISLLPLPIIAVSVYFVGRKVYVAFKDSQDQFANLTASAQETFSGIRIVKSYIQEKFELSRFEKLSQDYITKNLKLARYQAFSMPIIMVLVGLSQLLVLGYGGYQVVQGRASLGGLTQFFIYLNLLIWPIAAIGWITNLVQRASASTTRLKVLMETQPEILETESTDNSIESLEGAISFDRVTLRYEGISQNALENIDLEIPRGSSLGIVGTVGSGKSSLANLIPRLYELSSGSLKIDGHDIKNIPIKVLRENIAYVQQDTFLFSTSISENLRFGNPQADTAELERVIDIAQLRADIATFPDGRDTILGERGITLSGGQKQRLSIARALLKNPKILILDDVFSAVDTDTESRIIASLKEFMAGRTTIIISHRISTLMHADKIISIEKGQIAEQGNHSELLARGGIYSEMYTLQQLATELETEE